MLELGKPDGLLQIENDAIERIGFIKLLTKTTLPRVDFYSECGVRVVSHLGHCLPVPTHLFSSRLYRDQSLSRSLSICVFSMLSFALFRSTFSPGLLVSWKIDCEFHSNGCRVPGITYCR